MGYGTLSGRTAPLLPRVFLIPCGYGAAPYASPELQPITFRRYAISWHRLHGRWDGTDFPEQTSVRAAQTMLTLLLTIGIAAA